MTELVSKLRIEARRDPEIQHSGHSILSAAADEIERLRAALELIAGSASDKLQALQAKSALDNI